jgi:hypothetical protein
VQAEVSRSRSTDLLTPMETGRAKRILDKEDPFMTSNRLKHIEAMPHQPQRSEASKAPCSSESQRDQSASAAMKQTALGIASESLIEQIVEPQNIERAWKKVKANHRQTIAWSDRAILACRRNGRFSTSTIDRRDHAGRSALTTSCEHPFG